MEQHKYCQLHDDARGTFDPETQQGQSNGLTKLLLTCLTVPTVLWLAFKLTSNRSGSAPYNPTPIGGDDVYNSTSLPVVLWHGMGDSCCASWSIGALQMQIEQSLPGGAIDAATTCRALPGVQALISA